MNQRTRPFWIVAFIVWITMVGANVPSPLYAVYAQRWHFGPALLSGIFAIYVLFLVPSLLVWGQWSDMRGRRFAVAVGLAWGGVGCVLFLLAHSPLTLLAARAAQGLAVGTLSGTATAMLTELAPVRRLGALAAGLTTAGGTAMGPLLAGVLAQYAPLPLRLSYGVELAALAVAAVGLALVPETRARQSGPFRWRAPQVPRWMRAIFWRSGWSALVGWSITALFMALVPSYVGNLLHVANLAVAGGVVFLMLGTASVAQLSLKGIAPRPSMRWGLVLLIIGLGLLLAAVPARSLALALASTLMAGWGQGMTFLGSMSEVTQSTPAPVRGGVVSGFYVVIYAGVGLSVLGVGALAQHVGLYDAIFLFTALMTLFALGLLLWLRQELSVPDAAPGGSG